MQQRGVFKHNSAHKLECIWLAKNFSKVQVCAIDSVTCVWQLTV